MLNKTDLLLDLHNKSIEIEDVSINWETGYLVTNLETLYSYEVDKRSHLTLFYKNDLVNIQVFHYMNLTNKGDYFGIKLINSKYEPYKIKVKKTDRIMDYYSVWPYYETYGLLNDRTIIKL